jgi:hypothetical protein
VRTTLTLAAVLLAAAPAPAQATKAAPKPDPALAPVTDVPGLPRVLLIGDSISIGYTLPTRELLKGVANVHRVRENCGPTHTAAPKLAKWLGDGKWDVIHFNWGLHDIKLDANGKHQVEPADYEAHLRAMVKRLKATGAKLVWATTTPVPEGKLSPLRKPGDEVAYNAIARRVMQENGAAVDDLYEFAKGRLSEIQLPANVHFNKDGYKALAEKVAAAIKRELPAK